MPQTTLAYNLNSWPFLFLISKKIENNFFIFFTYSGLIPFIGFLLKYLVGLSDSYLIDIGMYEINTCRPVLGCSFIFWNFFSVNNNILFFFYPVNKMNCLSSLEKFYRNAWWLEKEVGESFNIFFKKKHDRRSLFLIPLIYQAPLRKLFPVGGFFEITLSQINRNIIWKHLCWSI